MAKLEDGIIMPNIFEKERIKLLLVCKEPNGKNHEATPGSFMEVWGKGKPDYPFAHRVAELSYGVLNNFAPYDTISKDKKLRLETLHRIAFINVKKEAGGDVSDNGAINKHIITYQDDIINQIKSIQPTHIILGLSEIELSRNLFKGLCSFSETGYGTFAANWNEVKILHFYHPSARVGNAALYALLKVNYEHLGWTQRS